MTDRKTPRERADELMAGMVAPGCIEQPCKQDTRCPCRDEIEAAIHDGENAIVEVTETMIDRYLGATYADWRKHRGDAMTAVRNNVPPLFPRRPLAEERAKWLMSPRPRQRGLCRCGAGHSPSEATKIKLRKNFEKHRQAVSKRASQRAKLITNRGKRPITLPKLNLPKEEE